MTMALLYSSVQLLFEMCHCSASWRALTSDLSTLATQCVTNRTAASAWRCQGNVSRRLYAESCTPTSAYNALERETAACKHTLAVLAIVSLDSRARLSQTVCCRLASKMSKLRESYFLSNGWDELKIAFPQIPKTGFQTSLRRERVSNP